MVVGAKICDLKNGFLWFVCGLYVGILTSPLEQKHKVCKDVDSSWPTPPVTCLYADGSCSNVLGPVGEPLKVLAR